MSDRTQKRSERIQLMLDLDELEAIDAWRFDNRLPSRAAAIRELIRRGLMNRELDPPETRAVQDDRLRRRARQQRRQLIERITRDWGPAEHGRPARGNPMLARHVLGATVRCHGPLKMRERRTSWTTSPLPSRPTSRFLSTSAFPSGTESSFPRVCKGCWPNSYTLLGKTHGFHWNVVGPQFHSLHEMFEEQYRDLQDAVDEIAERIRALGFLAPGSLSQFLKLTTIKDELEAPKAQDMLRELVEDNETVVRACRGVVRICHDADDTVTEDLMNQRLRAHEKAAWMLRASLQP